MKLLTVNVATHRAADGRDTKLTATYIFIVTARPHAAYLSVRRKFIFVKYFCYGRPASASFGV